MTKPQIWIAAILVVFIFLFVLERLTSTKVVEKGTNVNNPVPQSNISSQNLSPSELIGKVGCVNCHGSNLSGTAMGPNLHGISQYWSRDKLINYLRNPSSYMDSQRMKEYQKKFTNVMMPSFNQIDPKDLGKIAEYLLQLK